MFEFIIHPLQLFLDGAIGKDRQAKRSLTKQLRQARADCDYLRHQHRCLERDREKLKKTCDRVTQRKDQLQSEHLHLQKRYGVLSLAREKAEKECAIAASENEQLIAKQSTLAQQMQALEKENRQWIKLADDDEKTFSAKEEKLILALETARSENVQLAGEIVVLEAALTRRVYQRPQMTDADESLIDEEKILLNDMNEDEMAPGVLERVDLSDFSIALVGGHDNTRHHVIGKLQQGHGLKKRYLHELSHEHSSDMKQVKHKIRNCDFVFVITEYMPHKLNNSVIKLRDKDALSGDVVRLDSHGATGVLRDILTYIARRFPPTQTS